MMVELETTIEIGRVDDLMVHSISGEWRVVSSLFASPPLHKLEYLLGKPRARQEGVQYTSNF